MTLLTETKPESRHDLSYYLSLHIGYTHQLVELERQYADLKASELVGRRSAWENSQHTSIKGRDDDASFAVAHITTEVFRLTGEIKATQAWLRHVELQIAAHLKEPLND